MVVWIGIENDEFVSAITGLNSEARAKGKTQANLLAKRFRKPEKKTSSRRRLSRVLLDLQQSFEFVNGRECPVAP